MSLFQVNCLPSDNNYDGNKYQQRIWEKYKHHGAADNIRLPNLGKIIPMMFYEAIIRNSLFKGYKITIAASDEDESPNPVEHNNIGQFIPTFVDFFGNSSLPAFATRNDITPGHHTEHYRRYYDKSGQIFLTGLYVASEEKKGQVVRHNDFYLYILGNRHAGSEIKEDNLIEVAHLKYNYGQLRSIRQGNKQVIYHNGYLKSISDEGFNFACEFHNSRLVGAQKKSCYRYQTRGLKLVEGLDPYSAYKIFPNHDLKSIPPSRYYGFDEMSNSFVDSFGECAMFIEQNKIARPHNLIVPVNSVSRCYRLAIGFLKYISGTARLHGPLVKMEYCYLRDKSEISRDESDEESDERSVSLELKNGLNIFSTNISYVLKGVEVKREQYQQYWRKLLSQYHDQFPQQYPLEIITLILQFHDEPELMCKFYIDSLLSGSSPFIGCGKSEDGYD
jgi:hypothetical protein